MDAALESYVEWRAESLAVELAYRRWRDAGTGDRELSFAAYVAALDREERACDGHAGIVRWLAGPALRR